REGVRRNDADRPLEAHEVLFVEGLRIDDGRVDVREDPELVGATHVVAVARRTVRDDPFAIAHAHLIGLEGLDHSVRLGHPADPVIGLDAHGRDSSAEWVAGTAPGKAGAGGPGRPPSAPAPTLIAGLGALALSRIGTGVHDSGRIDTGTSQQPEEATHHGREDRNPDCQRQAVDTGDRPARLAAAGSARETGPDRYPPGLRYRPV